MDAERLSLALSVAKLGDWTWDIESDVVTLSERAAQIFGIPPGPHMTWTAMRELLHPDDAERTRLAVEHALATGTDYFSDYRLINHGTERWVSATGRGVYDGDKVVGMLGMVQDTTEQLRTRERLRIEAESLETINRVAQMLSGELDLQKLVQSVTDAATELSGAEFGAFFYNVLNANGESYMLYTISGVPIEKFSGFPMPRSTAVFAPTFRGEGVIRLHDVRADSRFGKSAPYHGMPEGHLPVVSYLAVPVVSRSGEVIGGLFFGHSQPGKFDERAERIVSGLAAQAAVAVDNARLFEAVQRARHTAEAMHQRFRAITATNRDLTLYEHDRELRYTWVFPDHPEHVSGNLGKTDAELLPGGDGERLMKVKRQVLESGVGRREEVSVMLPSGPRVYDLAVEPRRDASGAIIGVGGVGVDVTERKQHELALRSAQESARHSELRLLEADRRKDEFLAMLAHELRNPLAPIRTGLHLMRELDGQAAGAPDVRSMMERQVAHMVRLVDDLLDVSRITSGKIQLRPEPVTLERLIRDAIDINRTGIDASGVAVEVNIADGAHVLFVDSVRMTQVLSNVLNNALKFSTTHGRVTVSASIDRAGDPQALIAIADNGVGIDAAVLPDIFELFVQGEGSGVSSSGGLGIGLSLARKLLEMHGGSIDAASGGRNLGSVFTIRIPAVAAPVGEHVPAAATAPAQPQAQRRVLIVDDNEDSAEMFALLVTAMGGDPRVAHDGPTAVAEASRFEPEVVLLDIGLPGMDGYEVCRRIRQALGRRVLIAAVTGWGQDQDKRRALDAGFDTHMTKPADPAAIEALLANPGLQLRQ